MSPCCQAESSAAVLDVLEVQAAQDLRAEGGPVQLVAPAGLEDVAGSEQVWQRGAVLHGQQQRLQEGPVVLLREELVQAGQELPDQLLFFLLGFRLRDVDRAGIVQRALVLLAGLRRQRRPVVVLGRDRPGAGAAASDLRSPGGRAGCGPCRDIVREREALLHFLAPCAGLAVAMSAQVLAPSAPMCGADQVGR